MKFARLLHLVDSSIPTGSFAYSYGLESSITFGLIQNQFELRNYLYAFLQQVVSMEFPFMNSCFWLQEPELQEELYTIAEEYDAMMLVPVIHKASVVQGKNWLRLLESFYPEASMQHIREWFTEKELPLHFVLVYALCLKRVNFTLEDVQTMYLHMALRDQVSAAIRLGFIGPMEGHKLQHAFYTVFDNLMESHGDMTYTQATRSAFILDTSQVFHEDIYSKLFQN
ncbi:urease accessory protein UreF [Pontibacter pamirensis]|uniref:urease accessory protein UreF n=1 Tax=Pontibacter pamirensis TaxID=2562824 RepID=UPI001389BCAB|nr:urease accessory UreF family protein [Pontibacter pamirensis]